MHDLREFFFVDGFELFVASFELFERLHHGLRHAVMRFLRAAYESKLLPRGDAFVAVVVVEPHAQQTGLRLGFLRLAGGCLVR